MFNLRRHKNTRLIQEKGNSVNLLRHILPVILILVIAVLAAGYGQKDSGPKQRSQAALELLLSCTMEQAEDFDAAMSTAFAEPTESSGIGLTAGNDGELMEYFAKRFDGSMTDACIEDLTMSRMIYRSAALAKDYSSDIDAGNIELTKYSEKEECYDFSAELKTSAGNPAAKASGTVRMEKDGTEWKASHITLTLDEM